MPANFAFLWWFDGVAELGDRLERARRALSIGPTPDAGGRIVDGAGLVATALPPRQPRDWQPARAPDGRAVLFAGHLANRDALARDLACAPAADDAALYAAAAAAWGEAAESRIVGEYAAILWDAAGREATLVRSPIAAPPIHYWLDDEKLLAATAPRGLFATGAIPREIDEQKIADTLFLNYAEAGRTWFRGVRRLGTGSRLTVRPGRAETRRYYDLAALPEIRPASDAAAAEAALGLLDEGVRTALAGARVPAVSLSGGLDSQAVAALAVGHLPEGQRLPAFTGVPEPGWDEAPPPDRFFNEAAHAEALAAMYPAIDLELVDAAGAGLGHRQEAMFLLMEMPPRNAMNLHWIHEIHAAAARRGCDVLLTGASGNATFSFHGAGLYPSLLTRGRWWTLLRELAAIPGQRPPVLRPLVARAILPLLPRGLRARALRARRGAAADPLASWCPLDPGWAETMRVAERARDLGLDPNFAGARSTREWRVALLEQHSVDIGDIDHALWAIHGVAPRDPTAYRPLVEFCLGLPDEQYLKAGKDRLLARRMLRGLIPETVRTERRRGVQAADWHRRLGRIRGELIDEIDRLAGDPAMRERLNLPRLRAALEAYPEQTPAGGSAELMTLRHAVTRALTTARFIRYVEGTNQG